MAGDSAAGTISGAAWSKQDVAGVAVALIGLGLLVLAVGILAHFIACLPFAHSPGSTFHWDNVRGLMWMLGPHVVVWLVVSFCLIRFNRRIARAMFREEEGITGAPRAARKVALAFGIKVYSAFLATSEGIWLSQGLLTALSGMGDLKGFLNLFMFLCLMPLGMLAVSLYFLRRPGWLVSFADREGQSDEDEGGR